MTLIHAPSKQHVLVCSLVIYASVLTTILVQIARYKLMTVNPIYASMEQLVTISLVHFNACVQLATQVASVKLISTNVIQILVKMEVPVTTLSMVSHVNVLLNSQAIHANLISIMVVLM